MGPAVLRIKDPQKIQASWKQYASSKSSNVLGRVVPAGWNMCDTFAVFFFNLEDYF